MGGVVNLVSGGVDSSLIAVLMWEQGLTQHPLFIDYGQRARDREWEACCHVHARHGLPAPTLMNLGGFGQLVPSGLTTNARHVADHAFLPGRNLLFLLTAASYAVEKGASGVAIGLLSDETHLFPGQTRAFVDQAEAVLSTALGQAIQVAAPLMDYRKADVLQLAKEKGVSGTYSCHADGPTPCGVCISCRERCDAEQHVR